MAKTAEQKAAKAAAKAESQQLKSAQKAEVAALKSVGATKSAIKAEQKANKVELKALTQAQKSGTYTPRTDLTGVLSGADTYANQAYAQQVAGLLNSAAQNYTDYNIATVNKRGNVTTGVGLDKLVDYELGKTGDKFNKLMDRAQTYVGNTYSAADLAAQGVRLKEDKKNPGLYKWSTGGDGNKEITYFTQNPDGTYTGAGINRVRTEAQDGGLFDTALGKIALGIGGFYLGPSLGVLGTGLLGGAASKLTGGEFLPGALAAGGGAFAGTGGFSNIPGVSDITSRLPSFSDIPGVSDIARFVAGPTQPAAPIYDAVTGQMVSGGETLSGVLTGTGQNLGSFGQLGSAMPFNPANISLSPTIPGLEAQIGTAGFGSALRPAAELAADLVAAGFAPGTAANLAGTTAAGIGATNLLGGATALAPVASGLSWIDKLKGLLPSGRPSLPFGNIGSNVISGLLQPQQPLPEEVGGGGFAGASPDYNALIAALGAPRAQPRSLV